MKYVYVVTAHIQLNNWIVARAEFLMRFTANIQFVAKGFYDLWASNRKTNIFIWQIILIQ